MSPINKKKRTKAMKAKPFDPNTEPDQSPKFIDKETVYINLHNKFISDNETIEWHCQGLDTLEGQSWTIESSSSNLNEELSFDTNKSSSNQNDDPKCFATKSVTDPKCVATKSVTKPILD